MKNPNTIMSLFRAAAMGRISLFRNPPRASFIDTPFQRGGGGRELVENRFQRFRARETAEAVATTRCLGSTPLKRGVNQSMAAKGFRCAQKLRCAPCVGSGKLHGIYSAVAPFNKRSNWRRCYHKV